MTRQYIPRDKEDLDFVENLKLMNIKHIKKDVLKLLEWIQDGNWPQAHFIITYFIPYVNEIQDEIIYILRGGDELWKYWLITGILQNSEYTPNDSIMIELKNLVENPTEDEKETGVDTAALDVLEKFI